MPLPIPQIAFGGGEMSPHVLARVDLQKFSAGAQTLTNYFVEIEGGISVRAGTRFVKEVKDSADTTRLIPFEYNVEQAYPLEFGDQYFRIYSNGGVVLETSKNITGVTQANPAVVTSASHGFANGDQVYIASVVGMTELNGKFYTVANQTTNTFELSGIDSTAYTAYSSGGTASRVYTVSTSYLSSELAKLKFRQSNDVLYLGHRNHAPAKLSRLGATNWTLADITFAPAQAAPTSITVTPVGTTGSTHWNYRLTAVDSETGEESLPANAATTTGNATLDSTNYNSIQFTKGTGSSYHNIYKLKDGLYGYIGASGGTQFDDTGYEPDLENTPPEERDPFDSSGNYPEAVGLHEQRSWWGNTDNNPLTAWSSQTSQFENMNTSTPSKASDAVTLRLVAGKGNEIRHFRSYRDYLFVFTSGAVWTIGPGGDADAITPSSKQLRVQEYLACTHVPPLTIKAAVLVVAGQADQGFEVHQIGEDINSASTGNYVGSDLTVISRHLFTGYSILEWCYLERPYRLVIGVRSDGKLLVMSYMNEHQIYAWSTWETDGTYESVCAVPEGQRDVAYFVVKRTINGSEVRYIECLDDRDISSMDDLFFVDSGLTYDGTNAQAVTGATQANPVVVTVNAHGYSNGNTVALASLGGMTELNGRDFTIANVTANTFELSGEDGTGHTAYTSGGTAQKKVTVINGLDHLEGETVIANRDGVIEEGLTVSSGSVTLSVATVKAQIGLGYHGTFQSLPLNSAAQTISKQKAPKAAIVRTTDTRGLKSGTDLNNMESHADAGSGLSSGMVRINIPGDWERDSSIYLQSSPGLPQTILSLSVDTNVGGG